MNSQTNKGEKMNKWITQGITGLVLTSAVVASADGGELRRRSPQTSSDFSIDAQDYIVAPKLKDRMIKTQGVEDVKVVRILLDA